MDYVALLEGKVGAKEAGREMEKKIGEFSGLLSRDAAAKLIASEMGLIEREVSGIGGLKEGMASVDLEVRVEGIGELKSFPSGAMLRTLWVSDSSGEGEVNFWGEDAKSAGRMHILDRLEIRKGYVKMGRVNVGYKSTYSVLGGAEILSVSDVLGGKAGERFNAVGRVVGIRGIGEGNGKAFVFSIAGGKGGAGREGDGGTGKDGAGDGGGRGADGAGGGGEGKDKEAGKGGAVDEVPVSILNSPSKGEHLRVGDSVLLEGVSYNGAEIMVEGKARMLLRKNRENIYRGELAGIGVEGNGEGGGTLVMADGEKFKLGREALIKFLNLKGIREDMDMGMLVGMKAPGLAGRRVLLKFGGKGEVESARIR